MTTRTFYKDVSVMGFNLKRLQEVAKPESAKELEEAKYRSENREWLLKSMKIALYLEHILRVRGISKKQLSEMIDVSPAQVTKLLSGKENLGLKTIGKIEKALGVSLINIPREVRPYQFSVPVITNVSMTTLPFKGTAGTIESRKSIGGFSLMPRRYNKKNTYAIC